MASSKYSIGINIPNFLQDENETPSCASVDPELFFPQEEEIYPGKIVSTYIDMAAAKKICAGCPLRLECLDYGLQNSEIGIWGGLTESQREAFRRKVRRSQGRYVPIPSIW